MVVHSQIISMEVLVVVVVPMGMVVERVEVGVTLVEEEEIILVMLVAVVVVPTIPELTKVMSAECNPVTVR